MYSTFYRSVLAAAMAAAYVMRTSHAFTCLDEQGQPVDSWTAIKMNDNYSYYVYDASKEEFMLSPYNTNQTTQGCIMSTVNQLYTYPNDMDFVAYGMYNDDPPPPYDTASSTYAHAKGLMMTNVSQGFWLVHSMPNWPNYRYQGAGPFPDDTYAQSLMCVTVTAETANFLAKNLYVDRDFIYDSNITDAAAAALPDFNNWVNQKSASDITNVSTTFLSYSGVEFFQFAKSKEWGYDLWDDLVAPYFHTPMNVETWRSGSGGRMGSICGANASGIVDYDIYTVADMHMSNGVTWTGTQDHSKWAAARWNNVTAQYLTDPGMYQANIGHIASCVGDLNRMCSQESRGGGALCIQNISQWKAFNATIADVEPCFEYNPCTASSTQCWYCPTAAPTISPAMSYAPSAYSSTAPPSTATTSTAPPSTATTSTAPPSTATTSTAPPSTAAIGTAVPSVLTTDAPSAGAVYVTVQAVQLFSGVSYEQYIANLTRSNLVVQQSVATSIGYDLTPANIDVFEVLAYTAEAATAASLDNTAFYEYQQKRQASFRAPADAHDHHTAAAVVSSFVTASSESAAASTLQISYEVTAYTATFASSAAAYTAYSEALYYSVYNSTDFNTNLAYYAKKDSSTAMANATSSGVDTVNAAAPSQKPTKSPSSSDSGGNTKGGLEGLSLGVTIGVIAAVVAGFGILCFVVYKLCLQSTKEPRSSAHYTSSGSPRNSPPRKKRQDSEVETTSIRTGLRSPQRA